jgi:ABC-type branched-subunit amino acid transport system substrate-binding protein
VRIEKLTRFIVSLVLVVGFIIAMPSCSQEKTGPLRIGVLLDLTGPEAKVPDEVLNWAADNFNKSGGINGREVELVYKDEAKGELERLAQEFVDDASIKIVIGPETCSALYQIAPMFMANKKILISPTSTAGDIFRAFEGNGFIWRTCESDIAQIRAILDEISERGVDRISLIYEDSVYGGTFFDWTGFFCTEMGIELTNLVKFEPGQSDFSGAIAEALEGSPEYIVCVAFAKDAVKIKREFDKTGSRARLFFADAAQTPYLIEALGEGAEGLEGTAPSADPETGFETAYQIKFGHLAPGFTAETYDAFLLAIDTLARQQYTHGQEKIEDSLKKILSGRGTKVGWDRQEMKEAIELILKGKLPDISGASGPLEFDEEFGVDPLETFYYYWRVEAGDFRKVKTVSSAESLDAGVLKSGASVYRTQASQRFAELEKIAKVGYVPREKRDFWAVIIATDKDWENYRHQSDALAMYDMLKGNGVSDENIVLFLIDDIANDPKNTPKGSVYHVVSGKNLRQGAVIDYSGSEVTEENFKNVLLGNKTPDTDVVLETDENSNVLLYIVDHGGSGYIPFSNGGELEAEELKQIIDKMHEKGRYRQMFIMVDACFGESMALELETPGVIYFTGATKKEDSLACHYDPHITSWLADDFTDRTLTALAEKPEITISELYTTVYSSVFGSHVRLMNYKNFGDIANTSMREFTSP